MATKTKTQTAQSDPIDVTGESAIALAAAWRGVHEFLGGRVDNWEILQGSQESPEGGLVAHGFTVHEDLNPNTVVDDISKRNRRLEFFPAYNYIVLGDTPEPFTQPQEMTNFMVQYLKGSVEDGTAKTPEYVRTAVGDYKAANGLRTRRGPKRRIVRLDDLKSLDEASIRNIPKDQLASFLEMASKVVASDENTASASTASSNSEAATA